MDSFRNWFIVWLSIFVLKSAIAILVRHDQKTQTRGNQTPSPKVIRILNGSNLSDFVNYTRNKNQKLKWESDTIKLRCEPTYVTQWMWQLTEDVDNMIDIKVWKERTRHGFFSELTIKLGAEEIYAIVANFSCSKAWRGVEPDPYAFVTCIIFEGKFKNSSAFTIKEDVPRKDCHYQYYNNFTNNETKCEGELIVDLKQGRGRCNQADQIMRTRPCKDLDSCESCIRSQRRSSKNCGKIKDLSGNDTLFRPETLKIIYCQLEIFEWKATFFPYPTFNTSSWTKFRYFEEMDEALNNSIALYSLEPDESFSASKINPIENIELRTEFAFGETVEFVCIGIQYLYMKGFDFNVGGSGWNVSLNDTKVYELDSERHITRLNITFGSSKGNTTWVSCKGPIWNSYDWKEIILHFSLSNPQHPKAALEAQRSDVDGFEKLVCSYEGWPRPTITWRALNELAIFGNESSHTMNDSSPHPNRSWYQTRYVKKEEVFSVICTATNFLGTHASELTGDKTLIIIVAIAAGAITLLFIVFALVYWRYRKRLSLYHVKNALTSEEINDFYGGVRTSEGVDCEALLLPYNADYEISRDQFTLDGAILGSGQFGLVLKGNIGPITVAVKTVKPTADSIHFKSLLSELKILQFVGAHRNIVNLVGANTENLKKREVYLILDFCANGSLINLLRHCREIFVDFFGSSNKENQCEMFPLYQNTRNISLTTGNLITFACEIASAMDHLESKNVIHGDLAARNVLITDDLHAKICDFGLAKQLMHYSIYVQKIDCPLPLRWMALESLADMEFSVASDKWSYGVVLWEIFSLGELPYPGVQWGFESYKQLVEGYRMDMPTYSNKSIYKLMLQCWNSQPQDRPSYQHIIRHLKKEEVGLM